MSVVTITKENFEAEVVKSDKPVLVDFWASWCGPCKMLSPVVDEVAEQSDGSFKVGKINVDDQGELARQFRVMSIPTLIVFKNGSEAKRNVGVITKEEILDLLK
ncbi:MAG: thioredoxin [Lachnospiraceae bacterium]